MGNSVFGKYNIFNVRRITPKSNLIVVITGCDSGLGLLMAKVAHINGLTVIAGLLQGTNSDGARELKAMANPQIPLHLLELDVTKENDVQNLKSFTKDLLLKQKESMLHAVVNNAGVMVMGDFEWQTKNLLQKQWNVNICGTWDVTKNLLWGLRDAARRGGSPRVITVNSHCGNNVLRTLTPYSATKAALKAWSKGLRNEMKFYGVQVVDYIPGRVEKSNIMKNQMKYNEEMRSSFDEEQHDFYDQFFYEYSKFSGQLFDQKEIHYVGYEKNLQEEFLKALLVEKPLHVYKVEPMLYTFYYSMLNIVPEFLQDWLYGRFLKFPLPRQIK